MAIFKIENLTYCYPEAERPALDRLTLQIEEGEITLVTGPSGGGKTTLARALGGLVPDFFGGTIGGTVAYRDMPLRTLDTRTLHREIGMVLQVPERQLLMTSVERELAFGPENLGLPPGRITRRVMEAASALGITGHLAARTAELSGGMQQRVVIGAALAMGPRTLILDEPTSQLDPVSAKELLEILARLRDDLGSTIVLVEQNLQHCLPIADRVLFLENGQMRFDGTPRSYGRWAARRHPPFLPPVTQLFAYDHACPPPLTVREGRALLRGLTFPGMNLRSPAERRGERLVEISNLSFTYGNGVRALAGIDLSIGRGEIVSVCGPNGAGKSTLLKVISGLLTPSRGKVTLRGTEPSRSSSAQKAAQCGYLSQNPDDFLFHETVEEEIAYTLRNLGRPVEPASGESLSKWGISPLARRNPRELSAGERQCVALAAATVASPPLLLLDEPTRGLDAGMRDRLGTQIAVFAREKSAAVIVVTQDIEFAAAHTRRAILFFNGKLAADGPTRSVLSGELFYSSQISRLFRNICDGVVTIDDARAALREAPWECHE